MNQSLAQDPLEPFLERLTRLRLDTARFGKDRPALKKPLLLLLALSMLERGELAENRIAFTAVEARLKKLIARFGLSPSKSAEGPHMPFYHLGNDGGFWLLSPRLAKQTARPPLTFFRDPACFATFADERLFQRLRDDPDARARAAATLLTCHWPESWHEEILTDLDLPRMRTEAERRAGSRDQPDRRRSRRFVEETLANYHHRCAICGFHALLARQPFGLDAAHIRWVANDGPDEPDNGLALCKIHHHAFDRGAIGVDPASRRILLSRAFSLQGDENPGFFAALEGTVLRPPRTDTPPPAEHHLAWHHANIFQR